MLKYFGGKMAWYFQFSLKWYTINKRDIINNKNDLETDEENVAEFL